MVINPIDLTFKSVNPVTALRQGIEFGTDQRQQRFLEQQQIEQADRRKVIEGRQDILFSQQQSGAESQRQEVDRQRSLAQDFQKDMVFLADNQNASNYAKLIAKHPKNLAPIKEAFNQLDAANKESTLLGVSQFHNALKNQDVDTARSILTSRVEGLENVGRAEEANILKSMLAGLDIDPKHAMAAAGTYLKINGGDQFDTQLGVRKLSRSVAFNDGTLLKVFNDGSREVTNPAGDVVEGADAAATIQTASQFGIAETGAKAGAREKAKLETQIDLGAEVAGTKAAGTQAIKLSGDIFKNVNNVNKNIANIDRAIKAIDDGAKGGIIFRAFPSINAASAELESSLNDLGLDVVSSTTFGALSAGELQLALNTAAPRNLPPQELKTWLQNKKAAQNKLVTEMNRAATFLSDPKNTLNDWLKSNAPQAQAAEGGDPQAREVPISNDLLDLNRLFPSNAGGN